MHANTLWQGGSRRPTTDSNLLINQCIAISYRCSSPTVLSICRMTVSYLVAMLRTRKEDMRLETCEVAARPLADRFQSDKMTRLKYDSKPHRISTKQLLSLAPVRPSCFAGLLDTVATIPFQRGSLMSLKGSRWAVKNFSLSSELQSQTLKESHSRSLPLYFTARPGCNGLEVL